MRRYAALLKSKILLSVAYRFDFFFEIGMSICYVILLYYIWLAIYGGRAELNGMTFNQTFLYVSVSSIILAFLNTSFEWQLAYKIGTGDIVYDLIRPVNYQFRLFFENVGSSLNKFLLFSLPVMAVLLFTFSSGVGSWLNILLFVISILFSYMLNFLISFIAGLFGFYSISSWGISTLKYFTVSFFSGALIPLSFFPGILKSIAYLLPFHTIINTPMVLLTSNEITAFMVLNSYLLQIFWILVLFCLSRLMYNRFVGYLTVNGG